MNFQTMHRQRKFILIAAVAGLIAVFLPWVTISASFFGSQSTNGFHGIGILAFLAFVLGGAFSLPGEQTAPLDKTMWLLALGAGALALLAVVIAIANTLGGGFGFITPTIGFGLWIALAAALGLVLGAWLLKAPGDSLKSGFDSLKQNFSAPAGSTPAPPPASSAGTKTTATPPGRMAELERLIELKSKGLISEDEYQQLKARLL
jgi:hypothetical protein